MSDLYGVKDGFLVNDKFDELEIIRLKMLTSRYSQHTLGLTIAPTLDCNFNCSYCYEKNSEQLLKMSKQVQDKIVEFVNKHISTINSLNIMWYGGEPLLELNVIENISRNLITLCEKNNVSYYASMVTNGYNLTVDISEKLKKLKIHFVQVTIDGPAEIHDKRRPLVGGGKTYNQIMANLKSCIDSFDRVAIRINVDEKNKEVIMKIIDDLEKNGLKEKVSLSLGHVQPTNGCYNKNLCMDDNEFYNFDHDFKLKIENQGFNVDISSKYPILKSYVCGADSINSLVIDPNGNLFKCWSDIGLKEHIFGNLIDPISDFEGKSTLLNYMLYDPTQDTECMYCKFLPICMGGCPRHRIDKVSDRCSEFKYTLENYIRQIASELHIKKLNNA